MKKILFFSLLGLSLALIGCGGGDSGFDYDDLVPDSSNSNVSASEALEVQQTANGYNLTWKRTGEVIKYSYTALIVKNSAGSFKVASTNSNRTLNITCELDSEYQNDNIKRYICDGGIGVGAIGFGFYKVNDSSNDFYERAGNDDNDKEVKLPNSI